MDTTLKPSPEGWGTGTSRGREEPEMVVHGVVEVTRNTRSEIIDIVLRTRDGEEFSIVDDQIGCELANGMEGAYVEVKGVLIDARYGRWLWLRSFHCEMNPSGSSRHEPRARGTETTSSAA